MPGRLLIVAHRIPYTPHLAGGKLVLGRATGGLATGLRSVHERMDTAWIGGLPPMEGVSRRQYRSLVSLLGERRVIPIPLGQGEYGGHYAGVSNAVLWPVFHSSLDRLPLEFSGWEHYSAVNRRFATAIATEWRPGDVVWIHDYQLLLVPAMLRELVPQARIGFFLHIPFPPATVFRALPWGAEILEGLLGADLIGFHVPSYMANFGAALRDLTGLETEVDEVTLDGRTARLGAFPMGVDAAYWSGLGSSPGVVSRVSQLRQGDTGKLVVGIDRLDYTKGIPRRLLAFDRLFERHAYLRGRVRFLQVAVPSREDVESYVALRRQVDELVGRVNGRWGTPAWTPVQYLHRAFEDPEVASLYRAADVMLVSPDRDGMNLVAKEFVASRVDGEGVLVLSEFAGAASELGSAVTVNPFDVDGLADALATALLLPPPERRRRMSRLRARVAIQTSSAWASSFLDALGSAAPPGPARRVQPAALARTTWRAARGTGRGMHLVLDYDGTLVPFSPAPGDALPDPDLVDALRRAAGTHGVTVDVVSGRRRAELEAWLGQSGAGLYAEHGAWAKPPRAREWTRVETGDPRWREGVERVLAFYLDTVPGSFLEPKETSVAWHTRGTPAGLARFADVRTRDLRATLATLLGGAAAQVLPGNKVVEVAGGGATKGAAAALATAGRHGVVVAIGDDRTDEAMFRALGPAAWTVKVGGGPTRARFRMSGPPAVRRFLESLLALGSPIGEAAQRPSKEPAVAGSKPGATLRQLPVPVTGRAMSPPSASAAGRGSASAGSPGRRRPVGPHGGTPPRRAGAVRPKV